MFIAAFIGSGLTCFINDNSQRWVFKTIRVFFSHGKETFNLFSSSAEWSKHSVIASRFLLSHMCCSKDMSEEGVNIHFSPGDCRGCLIKAAVRGCLTKQLLIESFREAVCGATAEILIELETRLQEHIAQMYTDTHQSNALEESGTLTHLPWSTTWYWYWFMYHGIY